MAERFIAMETRLTAALAASVDPDLSVSALCAELGISRDTYYRLRRRFAEQGLEGLLARSRRPLSSPGRTAAQMEQRILTTRQQLRDEGWERRGPFDRGQAASAGSSPAQRRTIHRILVRAGVVSPQPRKRPRSSYRRFERSTPNELWQLDGTSWFLADGTEVTILRLEDDHARKIMATRAAASENSADAWECMLTAMTRHGAPAAVLCDGGTAFTARRHSGGLSEFEALLRAHGIAPIIASPHHPQTCGRKEREWATCKRWLAARPAAEDLAGLQRQLDCYDAIYNSERPHQGIGGQTPDERYTATAKAEPAPHRLPPPLRCSTVKVARDGLVTLGHRQSTSIGIEWAGTHVDVIRDDLDVVIIHNHHLIRRLRIDPNRRYQPSGKRPGPPRRPRLLSDKT